MQIAICGVGRVGQEISLMLVYRGYNIVLYDINEKLLRAEKIELEIAKNIFKSRSVITISNEPPNADIYVVSCGLPRNSVDEPHNFAYNLEAVKDAISNADYDKLILLITNPTKKIKNVLDGMGYRNVIVIGDIMDRTRIRLYGSIKKPRRDVFEGKGFVSHGVTAEVLSFLNKYTKYNYD